MPESWFTCSLAGDEMGRPYPFDWIHDDAKQLGFGKIVAEFSVKDGMIVKVAILDSKKMVSLEDARRYAQKKGSLVDPI